MSVTRCACGAPATNQALYRKDDGTHFLAGAVCDKHRYRLGRPRFASYAEVIDFVEVRSTRPGMDRMEPVK